MFLPLVQRQEKKVEGKGNVSRNSMLPATNHRSNQAERQRWTANSSAAVTKKGSMPNKSPGSPTSQMRKSVVGAGGGVTSTSFRAFFPRAISVDATEQDDEETSPFQPGDKVAALVAGWDFQKDGFVRLEQEMGVGQVMDVLVPGPQGRVTVQFPDGIREAKVQLLRPVEDAEALCRLGTGECYGELSLLYNTRHLATCKAVEPSVVYVVPYKAFKQCFGKRERPQETTTLFFWHHWKNGSLSLSMHPWQIWPKEQAWIKLLDEVHFLNALVRSERAEVARNAVGMMSLCPRKRTKMFRWKVSIKEQVAEPRSTGFQPNEFVMTQGEMTEQLWFVVDKGSCHVTRKDSAGHVELSAELRRGNHFGERAIFLQQRTAEVTVQAGLFRGLYDELVQLQQDHPLAPLSAAVVARTVTLRMPLELLRTQLQAEEGRLHLRTLLMEQRQRPLSSLAFRSWMQGYSMTLLRDVPFRGLAAFVTCPIDVIKTLRQKHQTEGMASTCLVLDGELLRNLPLGVTGQETDFGVPGTETSLVEYHRKSSAAVRPHREEIPFDELERTHVLGEGGFGAVYLCHRRHKPGVEYALKRLSKGYIVQANAEKQVCAERDILSMMDCDFITRFYGSYKDDEYVYMLIELVPGGHLYQLLCDKPQVLLSDRPRGYAAMFYSSCVILAFEYLHERRIAYRDLKLENVLLDSSGYAKLCDMGFARFVLSKTHTLLGTPEYMAPEMIDPPHQHNHMVDWWALGVLIFEMLSGQAPWDSMGYDDNPMGQLLALRESYNQGLPDGFLPPALILPRDFIKKLLVVKPERRLGANGVQEVKNSGWFKSGSFSWEQLTARKLPPPYQPPPATYSEEPVPKPAQASRDSMSEGRNKLFVKNNAQDDWAADF
eukprot:s402_g33.t1